MTPTRRVTICLAVLVVALGAQAGLEAMTAIERPELKTRLATLPLVLGDWVGKDQPVNPLIVEKAQTDDYLNRVYEDSKRPGRRVWLWMNYSKKGTNLRHSPEICLPSGGWEKVESQCRVIDLAGPDGAAMPVSHLAYAQGELVQGVGFWYYIFGEGRLERYVRGLKISSRSSHGRTTRGSSLTVEVFCPGATDPDGAALRDFAGRLAPALEPILPDDRAHYFTP